MNVCRDSDGFCYRLSVLADNIASVRKRIAAAAERSGRDASGIKLVAVSKTHPVASLREAIDAGALALGENKVQEAEEKITSLGRTAAEIGRAHV